MKTLPKTFVTPCCVSFRGIKDLVAHVLSFKHSMAPVRLSINIKDAKLCKTLVSALQDKARKWFNNLLPHGISSLGELVKAFLLIMRVIGSLVKKPIICFLLFKILKKLLRAR